MVETCAGQSDAGFEPWLCVCLSLTLSNLVRFMSLSDTDLEDNADRGNSGSQPLI